MDCQEMLKEVFKHAEQNPHGNLPNEGTVFVTVTIHTPSDAKTRDIVYYANGALALEGTYKPLQPKVLKGDVNVWVNNTAQVELKPTPGKVPLGKEGDLFPSSPHLKLRVSINELGFVSVQLLISGHAFLGRPPVTFKAVCTDGLLTSVTNKTSYTLSFTLSKLTF
jgi:hypothetical protein